MWRRETSVTGLRVEEHSLHLPAISSHGKKQIVIVGDVHLRLCCHTSSRIIINNDVFRHPTAMTTCLITQTISAPGKEERCVHRQRDARQLVEVKKPERRFRKQLRHHEVSLWVFEYLSCCVFESLSPHIETRGKGSRNKHLHLTLCTQNRKGSLKGFVVLRRTITYWRTFLSFETPLKVLWRTL